MMVEALVSAVLLLVLQSCLARDLPHNRDTPIRPLPVRVHHARSDPILTAGPKSHRPASNHPRYHHNPRPGRIVTGEKRLLISHKHRNFTLRLKPKYLLAPKAHVTHYFGNWSENMPLTSTCHYHGYVQEDVASDDVIGVGNVPTSASVNLCGGVSGFISSSSGDYFIYPDPVTSPDVPVTSHDGLMTSQHVLHPVRPHIWMPPVRHPPPDQKPPPPPLRRSKRHAGEHRYHMELLLVADETIQEFHGENRADEYLMTLVNMVDDAYHHPTLGTKINVVISKLMYIKKHQAAGFIVIGDAIQSLARFCHWVNSFYVQDESSPDHFDFAIFITKENIGPSGYAPVTGMCDPTRSCSVIRDEGFSTSFIIAHEIGHVFGVVHDGQGNECGGQLMDGRIMAPLVQSTFAQHFWSHCAAEFLLAAIDNFPCLRDDPHERDDAVAYPRPYGLRWTANQQCRQEFGEGFEICLAFTLPPCGALWCSTPGNHLLCKSKKGPALTGTDCGYGRWCVGGQCVSRSIRPDTDVDGGWSEFSDWMTCSRTCGAGVQVRVRSCNNPHPQRNGKPCDGPKGEFRLCNTHDCDHEGDFWALQCSTLDWEVVAGRRHTWLPYQLDNAERECMLTCKSNDTNQVFKTKEDLIDGTFCSYEHKHWVCIRGTCRSIGCDRVLDSESREDVCGVCNGDNSTCAEIRGSFNKRVRRGYQRMFIFPVGARHIKVVETVRQRHFMALRSRSDSVYLLNGKGRPYRKKHLVHAGVRWRYQNGRTVQETLWATGPLQAEYDLMVFGSRYGGRTANFTFQYFINNDMAVDSRGSFARRIRHRNYERYVWDTQGWSECSRSCGGGVQYEIYVCIDQYHHRHANSTRLCAGHGTWIPEPDRRPCNTHTCRIFTWDPQPWSLCSATCGRQGRQERKINCLHEKADGSLEVVEQNRCDYVQRPISKRSCNVRACPGTWTAGQWGECSRSCGGGVQERQVECIGDFYSTCLDTPPPDRQHCNTQACPGGQGRQDRGQGRENRGEGREERDREGRGQDPPFDDSEGNVLPDPNKVNSKASNNAQNKANRRKNGQFQHKNERNTRRPTVNLLTTSPTVGPGQIARTELPAVTTQGPEPTEWSDLKDVRKSDTSGETFTKVSVVSTKGLVGLENEAFTQPTSSPGVYTTESTSENYPPTDFPDSTPPSTVSKYRTRELNPLNPGTHTTSNTRGTKHGNIPLLATSTSKPHEAISLVGKLSIPTPLDEHTTMRHDSTVTTTPIPQIQKNTPTNKPADKLDRVGQKNTEKHGEKHSDSVPGKLQNPKSLGYPASSESKIGQIDEQSSTPVAQPTSPSLQVGSGTMQPRGGGENTQSGNDGTIKNSGQSADVESRTQVTDTTFFTTTTKEIPPTTTIETITTTEVQLTTTEKLIPTTETPKPDPKHKTPPTTEESKRPPGTTPLLRECYDRAYMCSYLRSSRCKYKLYQNVCCETCYYYMYGHY